MDLCLMSICQGVSFWEFCMELYPTYEVLEKTHASICVYWVWHLCKITNFIKMICTHHLIKYVVLYNIKLVTWGRLMVFSEYCDLGQIDGFLWVLWLGADWWFSPSTVAWGRLMVFSEYCGLGQIYGFLRVLWLGADWWFSLSTVASSTNKTYLHYITEILLKVVLNTTNQTNQH